MGETITKQLREFQSKIRSIKKEGRNPHFKSTYAQHEDVFDYMLPILTASGLSLNQLGKIEGEFFILVSRVSNDHGQFIESFWPVMKLPAVDIQKLCAATTYVSRHAAMRLLGLSATNDDDDAEVATGRVAGFKSEGAIRPAPQPVTRNTEPMRAKEPTRNLEAEIFDNEGMQRLEAVIEEAKVRGLNDDYVRKYLESHLQWSGDGITEEMYEKVKKHIHLFKPKGAKLENRKEPTNYAPKGP